MRSSPFRIPEKRISPTVVLALATAAFFFFLFFAYEVVADYLRR